MGERLVCYPGSWIGAPAFSYQWLRDGAPISSSAGEPGVYFVIAADRGHRISCLVKGQYEAETVEEESTNSIPVEGEGAPPIEPVWNKKPPVVSGEAKLGATLTCERGEWAGSAPLSYAYLWLRDEAPIPSAHGERYTVSAEDEGHRLSCQVTASNAAGTQAVASKPVLIAGKKPELTEAPRVLAPLGSEARTGDALTCYPGAWSETPAPSFSYQWVRDGAVIATGSSYAVGVEDELHRLSCRVIATNEFGVTEATSSNSVAVRGTAPLNTSPPKISPREAQVGALLTCEAGRWSGEPAPSLEYVWLRGQESVGTGTSYRIQPEDRGQQLACEVIASNSEGMARSRSQNSVVPPVGSGLGRPANRVAPTVVGEARVGAILSCEPGEWTGSPTPSLGYQWLRDGEVIEEATSATHPVVEADEAHTITCRVDAVNEEGSASAASSNGIAIPGTPPQVVPGEEPVVEGVEAHASARVGQPLTCQKGGWRGTPAPTFTFQWLRDGVPIATASDSNAYTIAPPDMGEVISCRVIATNASGVSEASSTNEIEVEGVAPFAKIAPEASVVEGAAPTVGAEVECKHGSWGGAPAPASYEYRWLLDGLEIPGETRNRYSVRSSDRGHFLYCKVTALNSVGAATATSNGLHVPGVAPRNLIAPAISGSASIGSPLTCLRGTWEGKPPPEFRYQWYRDGVAMTGATAPGYTVQNTDAGSLLSCDVIASNTEGTVEAESSNGIAIPLQASAPAARSGTASSTSTAAATKSGPSLSKVLQALEVQLTRAMKSAHIRSLLRSGSYSFSFTSPAAGTLRLQWLQIPKGLVSSHRKPLVLAQVTVHFSASAKQAVKLALTRSGRKLLQQGTTMKLSVRALFSRPGRLTAVWTRSFVLSR